MLGSDESAKDDSHSAGLLEYPQYTRPPLFKDWEVPEILLSGNHGEIARWRRRQAIIRSGTPPELLDKAELSAEEIKLVNEKGKRFRRKNNRNL